MNSKPVHPVVRFFRNLAVLTFIVPLLVVFLGMPVYALMLINGDVFHDALVLLGGFSGYIGGFAFSRKVRIQIGGDGKTPLERYREFIDTGDEGLIPYDDMSKRLRDSHS